MKKILICFLALVTLVLATSCKNEELNNNIDNIENNQPENNQSVNYDRASENSTEKVVSNLSIKDLKAMDETASSYFEYEKVDGGISITNYTGQETVVVIPQSIDGNDVIAISEYAFANNETLEGVRLPNTVTYVFNNVFTNCSNLKIFVAGANLKMLGEYAFNYCVNLNEVELNEGLEEIQFGCFSNNNIRELYIPASTTILDAPIYVSDKDSITIISVAGSEAEKYANNIGLKFKTK